MTDIGEGVERDVGELRANKFSPKYTTHRRLNLNDADELVRSQLDVTISRLLWCAALSCRIVVKAEGLGTIPLDNFFYLF